MCKMCLEVREAAVAPVIVPEVEQDDVPEEDTPAHFPQWRDPITLAENDTERDLITMLLFAIVCLSMVAVVGVLVWQIISLLRLVTRS